MQRCCFDSCFGSACGQLACVPGGTGVQQGGKSWWASPRMVGTVPSSSQEAPSGLGQPPEQASQQPPAPSDLGDRSSRHDTPGHGALVPAPRGQAGHGRCLRSDGHLDSRKPDHFVPRRSPARICPALAQCTSLSHKSWDHEKVCMEQNFLQSLLFLFPLNFVCLPGYSWSFAPCCSRYFLPGLVFLPIFMKSHV